MAVVYTDVQDLATEFASLGQERIDPFIARAQRRVSESYWGDLYDDAVLYMAAHLLARAERPNAGGPVTSEAAGSLSRSYAIPAGCPQDYATTAYGVEYWSMLRSRVPSACVV